MKALSIRQPWAACIAAGHKDVENRTWGHSHRGLVAIHASATVDPDALLDPDTASLIREATRDLGSGYRSGGAILAVARIEDVHPYSPYNPGCCYSRWAERHAGVWHWVLAEVRRLDAPIPAKGRLLLWETDADLTGQITAQLQLSGGLR